MICVGLQTSGQSSHVVQIKPLTSGRHQLKALQVYRGQKGKIEGVDWSPYGPWVASASANRTAHVWSPSPES